MVDFDTVIMIIVGLGGLVIGSFLNVLIGRYRELETVVNTRSHCPKCKHIIAWYDLFPLLSFVALRAKCRYCSEKISWQYPLIEGLTAALFIHLYLVYGLSWQLLLGCVLTVLLIVISVIDLKDMIIPDEYMLPALLVGLVFAFSYGFNRQPFWGVLIAGGGLAGIVLLSRERWMGAGDIGLGILLGLMGGLLGSIVGLVIAFMLGMVASVVVLIRGKRGLGDRIPFGPFLAIGSYIALIWGPQLANWYLTFVHYY